MEIARFPSKNGQWPAKVACSVTKIKRYFKESCFRYSAWVGCGDIVLSPKDTSESSLACPKNKRLYTVKGNGESVEDRRSYKKHINRDERARVHFAQQRGRYQEDDKFATLRIYSRMVRVSRS